MILQKVKLTKLATDDGNWDFSKVEGVSVGIELWVRCNTFCVETAKHKGSDERFRTLVVRSEDGTSVIPVEVLEFTSSFRVEA